MNITNEELKKKIKKKQDEEFRKAKEGNKKIGLFQP